MQCYKHLESTLKKQFFFCQFSVPMEEKTHWYFPSKHDNIKGRALHFLFFCLSVCENWMQTSALHCARHWKGVTAAKGRSSPSLGTISENKDLGVFSISLSSDLLVPGGPANKPLPSSTHFISPSLWGGRRPPSPSCADLRYCPPRGGHLWSSRASEAARAWPSDEGFARGCLPAARLQIEWAKICEHVSKFPIFFYSCTQTVTVIIYFFYNSNHVWNCSHF